jgi:hypothetical protein
LFIACLRHLQAEHLLEHVDPGRLFSNITEIYEVNIKFWLNYIQPLIDRTRATGHLFDPSLMLPGFLRVMIIAFSPSPHPIDLVRGVFSNFSCFWSKVKSLMAVI